MSTFSPGSTLGRYRIVRLLGTGSMGEVYLAEDPQIGRQVAIKTLRFLGVRPEEMEERQRRFMQEARTGGSLNHPRLVTLFDADEDGGFFFLAFEYVPGSDLSVRLREEPPLTLGAVLEIARQTCEGLDHAHQRGVIHRDIKPSNILLDDEGDVKISDFGIAKMVGQATELTVAGSVLGSPHYLSPEQIKGEELDGRCDLFSLGVVLYEMLTRVRPFSGETISTLVYQILQITPKPLEELRPDLPPSLLEVTRRMMAKERDDRFATAREAADALDQVRRDLTSTGLSQPALGVSMTDRTQRLETGSQPVVPPTSSSHGQAPSSTAVPPPPPPPSGPPGPPEPAGPSGASSAPGPPAAVAPSPPEKRKGLLLGLVALGLAALVLLVAVTWFLRGPGSRQGEGERAQSADARLEEREAEALEGPPVATEASERLTEDESGPEDEARPGEAAELERPPEGISPVPPAEDSERPSVTREERRPAVTPPAAVARSTRTPSEASEDSRRPAVTETRAPREPAGQTAGQTAGAEEPVSKPQAAPHSELETGLALTFRVFPPDAFVLLDGGVIGRVAEYAKPDQAFVLPGPGTYDLTLRRPGTRDHRVRLQATADGPAVRNIQARLEFIPAEELDDSDLDLYRVQDAVAFDVTPATARVMVNGELKGPARKFAGGLRRSRWLDLERGRHRISLIAPNHMRRDFLVEATAGAVEKRVRVTVHLTPISIADIEDSDP